MVVPPVSARRPPLAARGPECSNLRLDRLRLHPEHLVDEPGIVGETARARYALAADVGARGDLLEDLSGVPQPPVQIRSTSVILPLAERMWMKAFSVSFVGM
jgi:hypothetical protein